MHIVNVRPCHVAQRFIEDTGIRVSFEVNVPIDNGAIIGKRESIKLTAFAIDVKIGHKIPRLLWLSACSTIPVHRIVPKTDGVLAYVSHGTISIRRTARTDLSSARTAGSDADP